MIIKDDKIIFSMNELPVHPNQKIGFIFEGDKIVFNLRKGKYNVKVNENVDFYIQCLDIIDTLRLNGFHSNELDVIKKGDEYYVKLPITITKKKRHTRTEKIVKPEIKIKNNLKKYLTIYKTRLEQERQTKITYKQIYAELSQKLGLKEETIKKMSDNKINPSIESAFILCDFFKITLHDLLEKVE